MIGDASGVDIPDEYLQTGDPIYVWLFLHAGADDGETEFKAVIAVDKRAKPTDEQPTQEEASVIGQAIAALNNAVVTTGQAVTDTQTAQGKAEAAQTAAEEVERLAGISADNASASAGSASQYADDAAESKRLAGISETNAAASEQHSVAIERHVQEVADTIRDILKVNCASMTIIQYMEDVRSKPEDGIYEYSMCYGLNMTKPQGVDPAIGDFLLVKTTNDIVAPAERSEDGYFSVYINFGNNDRIRIHNMWFLNYAAGTLMFSKGHVYVLQYARENLVDGYNIVGYTAGIFEAEASAKAYSLVSEGYATGKQNGTAVGPGSPYYNYNAEYFMEACRATIGQIPAPGTVTWGDLYSNL